VVEEKFVPTEAQLKNIIADTQVFDKDMEILVDIYLRFEKLRRNSQWKTVNSLKP